MGRYILRRLWQLIPTVLGVIILTFVLFNVAGGSPAAMTLGKNASARDMEEFDEQRGCNKPLFWGRWITTRAFSDESFSPRYLAAESLPGARWNNNGVSGHAVLTITGPFSIQTFFGVRTGTDYRWRFACQMSKGTADVFVRAKDGRVLKHLSLKPTTGWQRQEIAFRLDGEEEQVVVFAVETQAGGSLELRKLELRRGMGYPWDSQCLFYLNQLAHGDFGVSSATNLKVSTMLKQGIMPSLLLAVPIFIVGLILSVALALVCAFYRDRTIDRFLVVVAVALMSVNYIVWIVLGQYLFSYRLGWFPLWGYESWRHLVLPILIGIFTGLGTNLRFYRTVMLDEIGRDYVRTAFAKGLSVRQVLFKHVLRNAMIPIITNSVIAIPFLYTGNLLLEGFFGIPGLGGMSVNALNSADIDVVRAVVLIGAVLYVLANLASDLCYAWADPRVRLE